jgi:phenylalanyl-tRNA synthetase beta chain
MLRIDFANAGYTESLTFGLCSFDEAFKYMRIKDDGNTAVVLSNPATAEFQVCRTSLLPGKTFLEKDVYFGF